MQCKVDMLSSADVFIFLIVACLVNSIICPPVTEKPDENLQDSNIGEDVVNVLVNFTDEKMVNEFT